MSRKHHNSRRIGDRSGFRSSAIIFVLLATVAVVAAAARGAQATYPPGTPTLGAHYNGSGNSIRFRVYSSRASTVQLYLFDAPFGADEKLVCPMTKEAGSDVFAVDVALDDLRNKGITGTVYYGYRAWGANWPFQSTWTKGSSTGFVCDVDANGNRFNPNKLLIDPYAVELSHDPRNVNHPDGSDNATGAAHRNTDTGPFAPKAIVLKPDTPILGARPTRPFRDEIIYEVHVRGLTMLDGGVAPSQRGTYAGAAQKADYLKALGVTAIEFLPVHEFDNDLNEKDPNSTSNDYWGYDTLGFFAPDRRYSSDRSPGGPTHEFQAMVKAFHDKGIKVYLDVVYNHTGEGGVQGGDPTTVNLLSWHGLDNPTYNELTKDNKFYYDNSGVDGNFNCANQVVRNQILDSLKYWSQVMGVDGFRFDLAPILGNTIDHQRPDGQGFVFDKMPGDNPLNRAVKELPVRPPNGGAGVDLIAEPWTASGDGQQQGNFPSSWAEWNDRFRDTFRKAQNKLGVEAVTPGDLATRFAGSRDLYQDDGRKPWHSINALVEHDGPTLRDLYSFNIDGRRAWNQNGDASLQRQAGRNGFALPLFSIGVPMFCGGDELYRTLGGNDNPYNLDNTPNYLDWSGMTRFKNHHDFCRRAIAFRRAHPALRPAEYFEGNDHNGNGLKDVTWYRDDANEPDNSYWNAPDRHFLAFRIDGSEYGDPARSIYVGYNGWQDPIDITLPAPSSGLDWYRVSDTGAWMESAGNFRDPGSEDKLTAPRYRMDRRSILLLVEK
jgi:glycogen operon protein